MLNLNNSKYLDPSIADQNFKDLFNKPGPYYNCYPILGKWKIILRWMQIIRKR